MRLAVLSLLTLSLSACSSLGYYAQLLDGQVAVLRARSPIDALISDADTDPALRVRLETVKAAVSFAAEALALPNHGSYQQYADLGRPYVLWNVFATPEFDLAPIEWCYPLAGCFSYRGHYDLEGARAEAQRQRELGNDVYIGGVPAYSTLGWFNDPVLNTMLRWNDQELVGTLFHELAHQRVFVKSDTAFNESFASFVQEEGLRRWLQARGETPLDVTEPRRRNQDFVALVQATRERLQALYQSSQTPTAMRAAKRQVFEQMRESYQALRDGPWRGYAGYDQWFEQDLDNAALLPVGLYNTWTPAFGQLFAQARGKWPQFYDAVERLGERSADERKRMLDALLEQAQGD